MQSAKSSAGSSPSCSSQLQLHQTLKGIHRSPITAVAFNPIFESTIATASEDACIRIIDTSTCVADGGDDGSGGGEATSITLKGGHTKSVTSLVWDPKGVLLISSSADLTIKIWDTLASSSPRCLKTLHGHDHAVSHLAFLNGKGGDDASDDRIVSASRDSTLRVWNVSTGYCDRTFSGHDEWVRCVAADDESKILASASGDKVNENSINQGNRERERRSGSEDDGIQTRKLQFSSTYRPSNYGIYHLVIALKH